MTEATVFILHRKSANEPYVKEAVKTVRKEGYDLRVLVQCCRVRRIAEELAGQRLLFGGRGAAEDPAMQPIGALVGRQRPGRFDSELLHDSIDSHLNERTVQKEQRLLR